MLLSGKSVNHQYADHCGRNSLVRLLWVAVLVLKLSAVLGSSNGARKAQTAYPAPRSINICTSTLGQIEPPQRKPLCGFSSGAKIADIKRLGDLQ